MAHQENHETSVPEADSPSPSRPQPDDYQPRLWPVTSELDRQRDRISRRYSSQVDVNSWLDPALNFLRRHEERSPGYIFNRPHTRSFQSIPQEDEDPASNIDLRSLEPVVDPDTNLFCPICHCLFVQPLQLPCEHVFCADCLKSTPNEQGISSADSLPCPSCRRTCNRNWIVKAPKLIDRILDDVVMKCPSSGCKETIARASVANHVSRYCQYALVDCPSEDCEEKIERRFIEQDCLHKPRPCDDCSKELREFDLERHRRNSCEEAFDECAGCKQPIRACEIDDHSETCPEVEVACRGQEYGCEFSSQRRDMLQHETRCLLSQAGPYLSKQVARIDDHESTIKDLRQKNRALAESVTTMHSTIQDVLCDDSNNHHGSADPGNSSQPFDSQIAHLLDLHSSLEDQVRRIEAAVATLDAKIEVQTLNQNLRATEEKLHRDAVEVQLRRQLQWLVSAKLQSQRAASSLLRAAGQDPPTMSDGAGAGPSGTQPSLGRRRSDEGTEMRGGSVLPTRRLSDGGREKL